MLYAIVFVIGVVYYVSYSILIKKYSSGSLLALIPTGIIAGLFWWFIEYRHNEACFILLIGLAVVFIIANSVMLIRRKHITSAVIALIPFFVCLLFVLYFISINVPDPCAGQEECMNETGLFMAIGLNFLVLSGFLTVITHLLEIYKYGGIMKR